MPSQPSVGDIWLDSNNLKPVRVLQLRAEPELFPGTALYIAASAPRPSCTTFLFPPSFSFTPPQPSYTGKKLAAGLGMAAERRTIGMGMDYSPSSKAAARWAVDNLLKAGDRIILVHVLPKGADASHKELWKSTGSRKYHWVFTSAGISLEFRLFSIAKIVN